MFLIYSRSGIRNEEVLGSSFNIKLKYTMVRTSWCWQFPMVPPVVCCAVRQLKSSALILPMLGIRALLGPQSCSYWALGGELSPSSWRDCFNFFVFITNGTWETCLSAIYCAFFSFMCFLAFYDSWLFRTWTPGTQNVPKPWTASESTTKEKSNFNLSPLKFVSGFISEPQSEESTVYCKFIIFAKSP